MTAEPGHPSEVLEAVVAAVRRGKYASINADLVRRLAEEELGKGRTPREATTAARRRLHQLAAAYFAARPRYGEWLDRLRKARSTGESAFREECRWAMRWHASTRERLPILNRFYETCLGDLGPIGSILDVGCGLGPLTAPWMPLEAGAAYYALDIFDDLASFLNEVWPLLGLEGRAQSCDVVANLPKVPADLALLLKFLPCVEQLARGATLSLLDALDVQNILVSFPVRSLGGRWRNMPINYEAGLREMVRARPWVVRRFAFESELAFLIAK